MAAGYCYEGMRFLALLFDIQMRCLVYMRYLWRFVTRYVLVWDVEILPTWLSEHYDR